MSEGLYIDRWEKLPEEKKQKLNIVKVENLDFMAEDKEKILSILNDNTQYDVLFNVLGSRVGRGEEEFRKVDFTYVVNSCILCEKLNISHFSNCSAANASKDSWFLYSRVKGEAEEECLKRNVNYVSILRPGIILNRDKFDILNSVFKDNSSKSVILNQEKAELDIFDGKFLNNNLSKSVIHNCGEYVSVSSSLFEHNTSDLKNASNIFNETKLKLKKVAIKDNNITIFNEGIIFLKDPNFLISGPGSIIGEEIQKDNFDF